MPCALWTSHLSVESPPRCARARCPNFHLHVMASPPCMPSGETSYDRPFRYEEHAGTRESSQDKRVYIARARSLSLRRVTIIVFPPRPQVHIYSLINCTSAHSQAQFQHYKVYIDHTLTAAVYHGRCSFRVIGIQYPLTATIRSNFRPVDKVQTTRDSPSPELSGVDFH